MYKSCFGQSSLTKKCGRDKYGCNMFSPKTNWKILTCL